MPAYGSPRTYRVWVDGREEAPIGPCGPDEILELAAAAHPHAGVIEVRPDNEEQHV